MIILKQVMVYADTTKDALLNALLELNATLYADHEFGVEIHHELMDVVTIVSTTITDSLVLSVRHQAYVEVKHNGLFLVHISWLGE